MDISNIKVTDQDVKDFKSFKIGTYNQPRLRSLFKTDQEYIDYMKSYMSDHITLKNDPAVIQESKFDVQNQRYSNVTRFKKRLSRAYSNKEYQVLNQVALDFQKAYSEGYMECNQYSIRRLDGTKIIVTDKANGETSCFTYPTNRLKRKLSNGDFDLIHRKHNSISSLTNGSSDLNKLVSPFNLKSTKFSSLNNCLTGFSKNLGFFM
jgi:hypothetical protein